MGSEVRAQVPEMLRGTVVTHRRRCGKPNCRCANGQALHEQVVLTYSFKSRARSVTLPEEMVEPVRDATERYRQARVRLEAQGNAGLEELVSSLAASRKTGRTPSGRRGSSSRV